MVPPSGNNPDDDVDSSKDIEYRPSPKKVRVSSREKAVPRRRKRAKSQAAETKDVDAALPGEKDEQNAVIRRVGDLGHTTDGGLQIICHRDRKDAEAGCH